MAAVFWITSVVLALGSMTVDLKGRTPLWCVFAHRALHDRGAADPAGPGDLLDVSAVDRLTGTPEISSRRIKADTRAAVARYRQARQIALDRIGDGPGRQSLSNEATFTTDLSDWRLLRATRAHLAAEVAPMARPEGLAEEIATLEIRFQGLETHSRQLIGTSVDRDRGSGAGRSGARLVRP